MFSRQGKDFLHEQFAVFCLFVFAVCAASAVASGEECSLYNMRETYSRTVSDGRWKDLLFAELF